MNSFRSLNGESGVRIGLVLVVGLAALCLMYLTDVGKARAASVSCSGTVAATSDGHADGELAYQVKCDEDVKGYSIISNREIAYFSTEVSVLSSDGEVAEGENFTCEGGIPAWGVGCFGSMSAGNKVLGSIATSESLCEAAVQPKFWAAALTLPTIKDKPVPVVSEPFLLKSAPCKVLNPLKKAKAKRAKVCAKVRTAPRGKARKSAKRRCSAAKANVKRLGAA